MVRHALSFVSLLTLTACGAHSAAPEPATPKAAAATPAPKKDAAAPKKAEAEAPKAEKAEAEAPKADEVASAEAPKKAEKRKLGDFHVYQYSGAFAKQAITLTEQVIAREEGDVLVVDFVLEEGPKMSALRVRMKDGDQVVAVSKIGADGEVPGTVADYDALVKKTAFAPDSNDEKLASERTSCLVGDEQVECDVTTYKVTIGSKQAKLTITTSASVPGRDIGGDVVTDDGKVLYSARLVERGNEAPVVESLAALERFTPEGP